MNEAEKTELEYILREARSACRTSRSAMRRALLYTYLAGIATIWAWLSIIYLAFR
jgi:hypothetical protein